MASVTHRSAGEQSGGKRRSVLLLGAPGSGKTRFAGSFPVPLFLDYDQGSGSACPDGPPEALLITTEKSTLTTSINIVDAVKSGKFDLDTGLSTFTYAKREYACATLVVDPINRIQSACKQFDILKGKAHMERDDWDTINNKMVPLLLGLNSLPINVVVVCHVRGRDGYTNSTTGIRYPNEMQPALQGALRDALPGYFDIVMHLIVTNSKGDRALATSERVFQGYKLLGAKDRHRLLHDMLDEKTGVVPVPCNEHGYPIPDVARAICGKF